MLGQEHTIKELSLDDLAEIIKSSRPGGLLSEIAVTEFTQRSSDARSKFNAFVGEQKAKRIDTALQAIVQAIPKESQTPEILSKLQWLAGLAKRSRE